MIRRILANVSQEYDFCIYYESPGLLVFSVIDERVSQRAIANVNAATLSDQRAEGKKGIHERATHTCIGEKGRNSAGARMCERRRCEGRTNSE